MKCEVCGRSYIAQRKGSHVCSNKCRAKKSRDKKATNTTKVIQSQRQTIRSQAGVMRAVMPASIKPAMVEKVSEKVGKDLTECKRPEGDHLYTEQDLWILIARIIRLVFDTPNDLMQDIKAESLIRDFEKRFDCKFDDMKTSHPGVRPGKTDDENELLMIKYASLFYSR